MSERPSTSAGAGERVEQRLAVLALGAALLGGAAAELVEVLARTRAIQPAEFPEAEWLFASAPFWHAAEWGGALLYTALALRALRCVRGAERWLQVLVLASLAASFADTRARLVAIAAAAALGALRAALRIEQNEDRRAVALHAMFARATPRVIAQRVLPTLVLWSALALCVPALAEVSALPRGGAGAPFALAAALSGALWWGLLGALFVALARALVCGERGAPRGAIAPLAAALGLGVAYGDPQGLATGLLAAAYWVAIAWMLHARMPALGRTALLPLVLGTLVALRLRALWFQILGQELGALEIEVLATTVLAFGGWVAAGWAALGWRAGSSARALSLAAALVLAFLAARAATPRFADFSAVTAPVQAALVCFALFVSLALLPRGRRFASVFERRAGWLVLLLGIAALPLAQREAETTRVRHALLGEAPFARAAWISAPRLALAGEVPPAEAPAGEDAEPSLELEGRYPLAQEAEHYAARRPPIVFFLWDGVRPERCGFGGAERATTPEADRFARDAVVFEHARANATATTASLRMLLSGRYQARTMLDTDHAPLLLGVLWDLGYRRFFVNVHGSDYNGIGAEAFLRGLGERRTAIETATVFFEEYDEAEKAARALALLEAALAEDRARGAAHPLDGTFLFLHSAATHFPWRRFEGVPEFGDEPADRFDHALAHVDRWSGAIWRWLHERGLYDEALQVLCSDHGVGLGERGRPGGFLPWEEQVRVPLVIKAPHFAPRRVEAPVAGIDLLPTLLALFRPGAPNPDHGWSLTELMAGRATALPRRYVVSLASFVDGYALHDAREGMVLLFFRAAGHRLLFDLARDPAQRHDLAPSRPELVRAYTDQLHRFLAGGAWGAPEHYRRGTGAPRSER